MLNFSWSTIFKSIFDLMCAFVSCWHLGIFACEYIIHRSVLYSLSCNYTRAPTSWNISVCSFQSYQASSSVWKDFRKRLNLRVMSAIQLINVDTEPEAGPGTGLVRVCLCPTPPPRNTEHCRERQRPLEVTFLKTTCSWGRNSLMFV